MSVVEKVEDDSAEIARQRYSEGKKAERRLGLMLVARHGHDRRLLEIAASVETMLAQRF